MKKMLMTMALLVAALALCSTDREARADSPPNIEAGAYASSLPPIYPTQQEQQAGAIWGTTEIMRCPNGYALSFESQSSTTAPTPVCVPMTTQQPNGGQQ